MKKLIALLAAMTMVFACGCSNTEKDQKNDKPNNSVTNDQNAPNTTNGTGVREDTDRLGDDVKNGVEDTGDAIKDGVMDAGDAIKDGAQDIGNAVTGDKGGVNNAGGAQGSVPQNSANNGTAIPTEPKK